MLCPLLAAWIEKLNDLSSIGVNSSKVCPLVQIAVNTGEREIGKPVSASVLLRHDMLNLESGERRLHLSQLAILTPITSTSSHPPPRLLIDHEANKRRALA
jgi:hypothetical protein